MPLDRLADQGEAELKRFGRLLAESQHADPKNFPEHSIDQMLAAVQRIASRFGPDEPYEHTASARAQMRTFGSRLITRYLEAFLVEDDPATGKVRLKVDSKAEVEVTALKMLVVAYVIRRPGLAVVQHGQSRVIKDLFDYYFTASSPRKEEGGDHRLFPAGARQRLANSSDTSTERARIVVDLISGLTEESAIQLHHRLSGGWTAPTLDATAKMG